MCTRALWNIEGLPVLVGRNMDWFQDMGTNLWALPAGGTRAGLDSGDALAWPVTHGSVVATAHDLATADGINDAGLGVHLLWLAESDYGTPDPDLPGISAAVWAQMFLDRFTTVDECVRASSETPFQLHPIVDPFSGRTSTVHLAIDDAGGDSAIVEYIDGSPHVYHGHELTVMTNSPPFDEQLALLSDYEGFGGDQPLPGTTEAADRFVRASYYMARLPQPRDVRHGIAALLSVMRNAAQPFGTADPIRPNVAATIWRTVTDLTNRVYLFESSYWPDLIHVRLDALDLSPGAPARRLTLTPSEDPTSLVGDVTGRFEPARPFAFAAPVA